MENNQFASADNVSQAAVLSQMLHSLKDSLRKFEDEATPENFAKIVSAIAAYGASGVKLWQETAAYAKKYPFRSALTAGVFFFAIKGLLGTKNSVQRQLPETYH